MEIAAQLAQDPSKVNQLRHEYLHLLSVHTSRPVLAYYGNSGAAGLAQTVNDTDMQALMEVLKDMKGGSLDLLLHSLGGSPDAADSFVCYLREKFDDIRVIVPLYAMSAATMIACGANRLVLARHSFLGPIDLQLAVEGGMVAAQDVLDQYQLIKDDFKDLPPNRFWKGPGLLYFPTLLVQCRNALDYGREVAERYLRDVMFKNDPNAAARAKCVAADLADHRKHKHHGRRLGRKYLRELGLEIEDLETDQVFQDLVLSVHHSFLLSFQALSSRGAFGKLVQTSEGRMFLA